MLKFPKLVVLQYMNEAFTYYVRLCVAYSAQDRR